MNKTPISITLYNENDEEIGTYQRLIIPWGMLKRALKFKDIDENTVDEKIFDELAGFVCEIFGNKFTIEGLEKGADISDMFAVIQSVVARAGGYFPNASVGK